MTHVEVLRKMRGLIEFEISHAVNVNAAMASWQNEKVAALTAAIAVMEALEKGVKVQVFGDSESGPRILHTPWNLIGQTVLIIRADALKEPTNDN